MMNDKMISLSESYAILNSELNNFRLDVETLATEDALNYVTVEDQLSQLDAPLFSRAAMDGYAIISDDASEVYRVIETVAAGKMPLQSLRYGTAIKIMTGAPIPNGAGKVIPIEQAHENGNLVKLSPPFAKSHIAWRGEDLKRGALLIKAATKLGVVEIANLINCGIMLVKVYRKPKVAIITSGDEIVSHVKFLAPGKIMNANRPMLSALCQRNGLEMIANLTVADEINLLKKILQELETKADILLLTGGASVGDFDLVAEVLAASGYQIHFAKVAIKPGKPTIFARKKNKIAFGLPGNPLSVYVTFHLFVLAALRHIFGGNVSERARTLPLAQDFHRESIDRMEHVPCRLLSDASVLPLKSHGVGHLNVLLDCDGFFVVEQNIAKVAKGEKVKLSMLCE